MLLEFSMFPLDKGCHLSKSVSKSLDIIDKSGTPYKFGPMGTCIEGEWEEVFGIVKKCFETMSKDSNRVTAVIKIDWKKGKTSEMSYKIDAIEKKLKRKLSK